MDKLAEDLAMAREMAAAVTKLVEAAGHYLYGEHAVESERLAARHALEKALAPFEDTP